MLQNKPKTEKFKFTAVPNTVKLSTLAKHMVCKDELYYILTVKGQIYLPQKSECPIEFLKDILA